MQTHEKENNKVNDQQYAVKVTFPEPIDGYWDSGKKGGGTFEPRIIGHCHDRSGGHPGPGNTIRWGCFRLNFWVNVGSGRTWREAASIAKRKLTRICSIPGTIIEIVKLERIDKASLVTCAQ